MSDSTDSFQASPQHDRFWAAEPTGPHARIQAVLAFGDGVGVSAVEDAVRFVVGRHESLRTTFVHQPGLTLPLQAIHEQLEPHIETLELAASDPQGLARARRTELEAPFDLAQGPLLRVVLFTDSGQVSRLILTISALCADPASVSILLGEVAGRLASRELLEDPLQYADFSAWQHELSDSQEDEALAARAAWAELDGAGSPVLPLTRAGASKGPVEQVEVEISSAIAGSLAEQAARYGSTPAAMVQAAWHAVLGRFSGEEITTVGYVSGERRHGDLEGALGTFARPVPVQAHVEGSRAFAEVLSEVDRARGEALVRQDFAPTDGLGAVEIGFVEYSSDLDGAVAIEGMLYSGPDLRLLLMCGTAGSGLTLSLAFDSARFNGQIVRGLATGLARTLEAAAGDPGLALAGIELLGEEERRRVVHEFNDTVATIPPQSVHELIARWALTAPDRQAVIDGADSITCAELEERANKLANRLRNRGVGPDTTVGLCTDRSIETVIGLVGILKAGAAYVPLHFEHPPARLAHQLASAGARTLITQEPLLERLSGFDGEIVCLDRDREELAGESSSAPDSATSHDSLAYVIFTSGSTGTPKGVSVTHGNVVNYATDIAGRLGADEQPLSFGLVTSISTDLGNTSVFGALCSGGTLVLVGPDAATDPGALAGLMEKTPLDVLKITPSHLGALLAGGDARVIPRRWLVVGGERAGWDLIDRVRSLSSCAILNHYGPTETTIGSCTFAVEGGPGEYEPAGVPIGSPIANTSCYVLDEARGLSPIGVPGRLFIAGAGVARGYTGEPELTAERFFPDPFGSDEGARMYDTGDLARRLPDGTLEFLGRVDEQLKIRGYRVEPAEVESALRTHPQVQDAVTVTQAGPGGDLRLIAYCTVDGPVEQDQLLVHLSDWLPEFMMPSAIVTVAEMPRTPSGKIDKLQLPDPDLAGAPSAEYLAPRTPLEEAVAAIWAQVLGLAQVGVEDDFFALGGHSLLATQVVAQVRSDFAVDLPLHSLFTCPTIATLAEEIVRMMGDTEVDETAKLMSELEGMSDEEAERLLAEDVPPETGRR
jgi:amino acid adenylation domain-containing protein